MDMYEYHNINERLANHLKEEKDIIDYLFEYLEHGDFVSTKKHRDIFPKTQNSEREE